MINKMTPIKVLISGATGWLGRETTMRAINKFGKNLDLTLSSSTPTNINIEGQLFKTVLLNSLDSQSKFDYFFDYAFLTREKIDLIGLEKYREINSSLIESSAQLIKKYAPKVVILASSGAVYQDSRFANNLNNKLYAELKLDQENVIAKACQLTGSKLIIVRIFNLSGRGINKSKVFAIQDFVESALNNHNIIIKSNFRVFRRYSDIGQLINLLIELALKHKSFKFDSGGVKVELSELATTVIKVINSNSIIKTGLIDENQPADNYFSKSQLYELLIKDFLNQEPLSLRAQIISTAESLKSTKNLAKEV